MARKVSPAGIRGVNATGLFSPVVQVGDTFYFSMVIPNIEDGHPESDSIVEQAVEVFKKMNDLLKRCDLTTNDLVSVTIRTVGVKNYGKINQLYARFLQGVKVLPSGAIYAVRDLPPYGVAIGIEFIAIKQS